MLSILTRVKQRTIQNRTQAKFKTIFKDQRNQKKRKKHKQQTNLMSDQIEKTSKTRKKGYQKNFSITEST